MLALSGGIIIGIAVSIMLYYTGKVTGISGIIGGIINPSITDKDWRLMFTGGLITGGILIHIIYPQLLIPTSSNSILDYIIAGLLVGFGTSLGNGCTSGHGVCGISRLSIRSILATLTFISFGIVSVLIFRAIKGEL